jgi:hypothetical protein
MICFLNITKTLEPKFTTHAYPAEIQSLHAHSTLNRKIREVSEWEIEDEFIYYPKGRKNYIPSYKLIGNNNKNNNCFLFVEINVVMNWAYRLYSFM